MIPGPILQLSHLLLLILIPPPSPGWNDDLLPALNQLRLAPPPVLRPLCSSAHEISLAHRRGTLSSSSAGRSQLLARPSAGNIMTSFSRWRLLPAAAGR
eukprot:759067-Hanusia_phi.AAC.4